MFYRFSHSRNLHKRIYIKWKLPPRPNGVEYVRYETMVMRTLERVYIDRVQPHCSVFRGSVVPKWAYSQNIVLDIKQGECPDIIPTSGSVVSEKVRTIIEKYDSFCHQFLPVNLVNAEGESVVEQPYYIMIVRRQIEVDRRISDLNMRRDGFYAYGNFCDEDVIQQLVFIENQPELKSFLETLPLWQLKGSSLDFFVNQELYDLLKGANVTGIDLYTGVENEHTAAAI